MIPGLWLLLRARKVPAVMTLVLGVELLVLLYGNLQLKIGQQSVQPVPIAVFAPVIISCALVTIWFSPQPVTDDGSARPLRYIVPGLGAACLAVSTLGLMLATRELTGDLTTQGACRDLAGFFGLSLIGAAYLGSAWFWIPPVLSAAVPMTGLDGSGLVHLLTWPIGADSSASAKSVAVVLLIAGLAAITLRPRVARAQ